MCTLRNRKSCAGIEVIYGTHWICDECWNDKCWDLNLEEQQKIIAEGGDPFDVDCTCACHDIGFRSWTNGQDIIQIPRDLMETIAQEPSSDEEDDEDEEDAGDD